MSASSAFDVLDARALRGPNLYAPHPMWRLALRAHAPVARAAASLNAAGLAVDGRDLGHLVGSTVVALREAAGIPAGVHEVHEAPEGGQIVVYRYRSEPAARTAGDQALGLVAAAVADRPVDVGAAVRALRAAEAEDALSPSLAALLDAARARGIPVMRRGAQHHQLGWCHQQEHLWGHVPGRTSSLGHDIAHDHERVLQALAGSGIPVPRGEACDTTETAQEAADRLGMPLTVKPLRGRGGVTVRVDDVRGLAEAVARARQYHRWVFVQEHVEGIPHRVLVVDGEVVAATRRSDDTDVTAHMHPSVALACRRAARLVGLDVVAVDLVGSDLETPLEDSRTRLVSLHPTPSIGPFLAHGAAEKIVRQMFPGGDGRVPLVAVTGTNGKTTTVRLIAHILKYAGARVGMAVTGALEVENQVILRGDWSGPAAAQTVLREPGVTHAVCEVARGGILRSGLGFDACDVAVMLNVAEDHLGEGGIETIEDLARLKGVILRATRPGGTIVLNADDPLVWAQRHEVPRRVIPFTLDPAHPDVEAHLAADPKNLAVIRQDGGIMVRRGAVEIRGADLVDIPLTLDGAALFNVQNVMAATAVAYALGLDEQDLRSALVTFNPSMNQLPGRMNLMRVGSVKVLVDYGHNVAAVRAIAPVLPRLAQGRKINVACAAGNRRDEDLRAFGAALATMYDRIYVTDADPRGRPPGETARIIAEGILGAGFAEEDLVFEPDEPKASRLALAESRPGDLVVLQADDVERALRLCRDLQVRIEGGGSPAQLQRELLDGTI